MKSNNTPKYTLCRTIVVRLNKTVQCLLTTVSPNSNAAILMLQAEAGFVGKHNMPFHSFIHVFRLSHIGGTNICRLQSRVGEAIDALRTFHYAANSVEWYYRTKNDAQQTESVVLWFVIGLRDPLLSCTQSTCQREQWGSEVGAISPTIRHFLLHPMMTDQHHTVALFRPTR
ncbi:hypothetical protein TNCV_4746601 [Trichonephila clavipes]|nr:hypothetical protein TNCV_4746601 [Trichonephila clavipes]